MHNFILKLCIHIPDFSIIACTHLGFKCIFENKFYLKLVLKITVHDKSLIFVKHLKNVF